jgi:archaeal flagellin FlaB
MMKNKKGESGIGTLIIFIAMLLVAAVAAGVLIQTTGSLQNKAITTGSQSQSQISTHIEVIKVTGVNGTDSTIENMSILMRLAPGSDDIFLNETVLTLDTPSSSVTIPRSSMNIEYLNTGAVANNYLKLGDLVEISFLSGTLTRSQSVVLTLIPKIGISTKVEFTLPEVISDYKVGLYPMN